MNLTVIIPAHNEERWIGACLAALLGSDPCDGQIQIIICANGCTDATVHIAQGWVGQAQLRGWEMLVLDLPSPGKLAALNAAEAQATGATLVWLDADVEVSPGLLPQLGLALAVPEPRYASGRPIIASARGSVAKVYARFWNSLPFARSIAPGFGVFAVNAAGRKRWGAFPDIISDDTFVRLHFRPQERLEVPATYTWPMVEGFWSLVRVRKRQDRGVAELRRLYPQLFANDDKPAADFGKLLISDPFGFATYALVSLVVRLWPASGGWTRGR